MLEDDVARPLSSEQSDEALLEAHRAGDPIALERLVRRYERQVFALMRRWTKDPAGAQDLAQRAFLQALTGIKRSKAPFRPFLFKVALNVARSHAREGKRWRLLPLPSILTFADPKPSVQVQLEEDEARRRARDEVAKLPKRQREVLLLRIDAELSFAQIAQALETTENNAKVCFHLAVKTLRQRLGGTADDV